MRVRFFAVAGSIAALGVGVAACGGDDNGGGGGNTVSGTNLTVYSSLPLQGTSRGQSTAVINGEKLALSDLAPGGKLGKYTIKYVSLDDSTAPEPGHRGRGPDGAERPQGVLGRVDDPLPRRVQLRRVEGLDPDPQQGDPADQPVEHLRRPDHERAGLRAGRAGQVLPDRQAHVRARRARATTSRARPWWHG